MRVVMSGGGTAGHIYPALTVAEALIAEGHEVAFVGTPSGLESKLVPDVGVPFHAVKARGFDRSNPLTLLTSAAVIAVSVIAARRLLRAIRPDVVVGFGGYVSLPVGLAAVSRRTPLVLHEQNSVPGLANRVLARWASAIGVTYDASVSHLDRARRVEVTGNPVRASVLVADCDRGRASLGLASDATMLLVFGGSRGARHINDTMVQLAPALMSVPSLQVLHVAGRIEAPSVAERISAALGDSAGRYRVVEYIDAMGDAIAAADLVIARSGATSIAEITAIGRAAILVPYPFATDDHQTLNAAAVEQAGGAVVVPDAELDDKAFGVLVLDLIDDADRRARMSQASAALARRDAAQRVVSLITEASQTRRERL